MPELPPVTSTYKLEGVPEALAKIAILEEAIKRLQKAGLTPRNIGVNALGRLLFGDTARIKQDAAKAGDAAGRSFGQRFRLAFDKELNKGVKTKQGEKWWEPSANKVGPGWLPFVAAVLPAIIPAATGLLGVLGGLGAAAFGAAAGLGALAFSATEVLGPVFRAFTIFDKLNTGQLPKTKSNLEKLKAAYDALNPAQKQAFWAWKRFDDAVSKSQMASQGIVLKLFAAGLTALTPALKLIAPLAQTAGRALLPLVGDLGKWIKDLVAPQTTTVMEQIGGRRGYGTKVTGPPPFLVALEKMSKLGIAGFGKALLNIAIGLQRLGQAFANSKIPQSAIDGLLKLTNAFKNWTGTKNFTTFFAAVQRNTGPTMKLLGELLKLIGNLFVAGAASGYGTLEIRGLTLLAQALNWVAKIPGIGTLVFNLTAIALVSARFGSVRLASALLKGLGKAIMGLSIVNSIRGTITGFFGMIGSLAKGLIASAVLMAAGWAESLLAMVGITVSSTTAMIVGSGGLILAIAAIALGAWELYKHWRTVWAFIKRISEDAFHFIYNGWGKWLLPILGGAGLMVLGLILVWQHWKTLWGWIRTGVEDTWKAIRIATGEAVKFLGNTILFFIKTTIHTLANAFGWVPFGIGKSLKDADKKVGQWVTSFNNWVNKIVEGRTVNVNVAIGSGLTGTKVPGAPHQAATGTGTGGAAPGWTWVGERGPELAYMYGGETVLSNPESRTVTRGYASGTTRGPGSTGYGLMINANMPNAQAVANYMTATSKTIDSIANALAVAYAKKVAATGGGFGNIPIPANVSGAVALGRVMAASVGWTGLEWQDLFLLWMRESGWNPWAVNPSSGAYGIPQSLGHGHPFPLGVPGPQIAWGLNYIKQVYGDPIHAWAHETAFNWYGHGGTIQPGSAGIVGDRGLEMVTTSPGGAATVTPLGGGARGGIVIQVFTQEINPVRHAAALGWELSRRGIG